MSQQPSSLVVPRSRNYALPHRVRKGIPPTLIPYRDFGSHSARRRPILYHYSLTLFVLLWLISRWTMVHVGRVVKPSMLHSATVIVQLAISLVLKSRGAVDPVRERRRIGSGSRLLGVGFHIRINNRIHEATMIRGQQRSHPRMVNSLHKRLSNLPAIHTKLEVTC